MVVCTHECRYPQRLKDSVKFLGAGVTGSTKPPDMVLGTNLKSSIRVVLVINSPTISPAPYLYILNSCHNFNKIVTSMVAMSGL